MLFNTLEFFIFLPIVFCLYWGIPKGKQQTRLRNIILLSASYFFYAFWDWKLVSLILLSTITDFIIGLKLSRTTHHNKRKFLLFLSIFINIGMLCYFKYLNFFIDSFNSTFSFFGSTLSINRLSIILPVGISFYTFQTLSYTIDIYRKKIIPNTNFIEFATFVSFFPQLVAGPIERAKDLLPQFRTHKKFTYNTASDGMRQILWGLFKKIVIADRSAEFVNIIFSDYTNFSSVALIIGAILFSFQIYGDFSGYSDIAIGVAKLFGFTLKQNFATPYFSQNIVEFWRRWHISLTSWFKDYLYIPLGGNKGNNLNNIRNIITIFLVSGLWHGANWTFIAWGGLNALFFIPVFLKNKKKKLSRDLENKRKENHLKRIIFILLTFTQISFTWIFFRSKSILDAVTYLKQIFTAPFLSLPLNNSGNFNTYRILLQFVLIGFMLLIEWHGKDTPFALKKLNSIKRPIYRYLVYYLLILLILFLSGEKQDFIYFQF